MNIVPGNRLRKRLTINPIWLLGLLCVTYTRAQNVESPSTDPKDNRDNHVVLMSMGCDGVLRILGGSKVLGTYIDMTGIAGNEAVTRSHHSAMAAASERGCLTGGDSYTGLTPDHVYKFGTPYNFSAMLMQTSRNETVRNEFVVGRGLVRSCAGLSNNDKNSGSNHTSGSFSLVPDLGLDGTNNKTTKSALGCYENFTAVGRMCSVDIASPTLLHGATIQLQMSECTGNVLPSFEVVCIGSVCPNLMAKCSPDNATVDCGTGLTCASPFALVEDLDGLGTMLRDIVSGAVNQFGLAAYAAANIGNLDLSSGCDVDDTGCEARHVASLLANATQIAAAQTVHMCLPVTPGAASAKQSYRHKYRRLLFTGPVTPTGLAVNARDARRQPTGETSLGLTQDVLYRRCESECRASSSVVGYDHCHESCLAANNTGYFSVDTNEACLVCSAVPYDNSSLDSPMSECKTKLDGCLDAGQSLDYCEVVGVGCRPAGSSRSTPSLALRVATPGDSVGPGYKPCMEECLTVSVELGRRAACKAVCSNLHASDTEKSTRRLLSSDTLDDTEDVLRAWFRATTTTIQPSVYALDYEIYNNSPHVIWPGMAGINTQDHVLLLGMDCSGNLNIGDIRMFMGLDGDEGSDGSSEWNVSGADYIQPRIPARINLEFLPTMIQKLAGQVQDAIGMFNEAPISANSLVRRLLQLTMPKTNDRGLVAKYMSPWLSGFWHNLLESFDIDKSTLLGGVTYACDKSNSHPRANKASCTVDLKNNSLRLVFWECKPGGPVGFRASCSSLHCGDVVRDAKNWMLSGAASTADGEPNSDAQNSEESTESSSTTGTGSVQVTAGEGADGDEPNSDGHDFTASAASSSTAGDATVSAQATTDAQPGLVPGDPDGSWVPSHVISAVICIVVFLVCMCMCKCCERKDSNTNVV